MVGEQRYTNSPECISALHQITRHELDAGWRPGEGDDQ